MAIVPRSNASAVASTVTMPAHANQDFIIATVWRNGSATAPTIPTGWTLIKTQTGTTCWGGVYYKQAQSTNGETTGTWTSANSIEINVYANVAGIGVSTAGTGSTTTITYPAATLTNNSGRSWVFRSSASKTATNMTTNTPTGYTARGGQAGINGIRACDTNGGTATNPTAGTQAVSPTTVFVAFTVELLGVASSAAASTLTDDFNTADSAKWFYAGGAATVSGGQLSVDPTNTGNASLFAVNTYDLTGSFCFVQVVNPGPGVSLIVGDGSNGDYVEMFTNGTSLIADTKISGTVFSIAWDSVNHRCMRITESAGTVFFDTSPDGSTWTNQGSVAYIVRVDWNVHFNAQSSDVILDSYNLPPVVAVVNTGNFFAMF